MKFGNIIKLASGNIEKDDLEEIFSELGIELSFSTRKPEIDSFRPLAASASLPDSKLLEIEGKMKNGDRLHALLVVTSTRDGHHSQQI